MYRLLIRLHDLSMRFGFSETFIRISNQLHRRFGLPALQPVRVKNK